MTSTNENMVSREVLEAEIEKVDEALKVSLIRQITAMQEKLKIGGQANTAPEEEIEKVRMLAEQDRIQKILDSQSRAKSTQEMLDHRTNSLISAIQHEFDRISIITDARVNLSFEIDEEAHTLWAEFSRGDISGAVRIPLVVLNEVGIELLVNKDVVRVLCDHWLEETQQRLNYHEVIRTLFCEDVNIILPHLTSGSPMVHKIVKSFDKNQVLYMVSQMQRLINDVVNKFPLHETNMNSWAMNHRLIVVDPAFEAINDPNKKLEYQVLKNKKYYDMYGWTALGLSDGVLSDRNYLMTTDLRLLTPFGQHHNPQRNLYSTLGMKGDELPRIRSKSMQELMDRGISRKGWNMVTAILDTPMNFEDQILVDKRHLGLSHTVERRFIIYGEKIVVKKGDSVKAGETLGYCDDGQAVKMNLRCDEAKVVKIIRDKAELSGDRVPIWVIRVEGRRFMRDGTKFSNLHGNKGIVRFIDLGYAVDPRNGKKVPIDVLISGASINRRKNFGQIVEMVINNLNEGDEPIVVGNDEVIEKIKLKNLLETAGFPNDGTWMLSTYCGEFSAVVGKMFWGVTKDSEDQLWDEDRTELTNNRELRTSGLKFSHVEMKALVTRFGPGNPLLTEILSHVQGVEILQDEIRILRSATGDVDPYYPVIDAHDLKAVNTSTGLFHTIEEIKGTIVDDEFMPEGFVLRLPVYFSAIVNKMNPGEYTWGIPQGAKSDENNIVYTYNTIFIPNALHRRCWRHGSGKWGLNTVGAHINHIVERCHQYIAREDFVNEMEIARAVARYFSGIAMSMGSKKGELSTYGMAIRYPFSSRATAVLSENLPKNTVEIHRDMANILKVKTGDVVLAERFPCLGFMSLRPQYVKVTDDAQCKFVIRVSGNSLVSMTLDFDGDTLFLASFHNPDSIELLHKEMKDPNRICEDAIEMANGKKVPALIEMTLDDFNLCHFPKPNTEDHADLVRKATGVKSHTGPVIALAYNLMRIVEANIPYNQVKEHANLELLLDFLGNTVFKQKHGIKSLQEEATDAICTGDVEKMVRLGFEREPSQLLCDLIRKEAMSIGVSDLKGYHEWAKATGRSKIINRIVRNKHRVYFATRSRLGVFALLQHLRDKPNDLPSSLLMRVLKSERESIEEKIDRLKAARMKVRDILTTQSMKEAFTMLSAYIDSMTTKRQPNILGSQQ